MMQVVYLTKNDNKDLRTIIELEYTREETNLFLDTVMASLNNPFAREVVAANLVTTVNTVIIDTLIRFVRNSDSLSLITGMQNNTLGLMFEVGHRHYVDLVTEEFSFIQQSPEVEKEIITALVSYINFLYLNNKEEIDPAILKLYEVIYSNLTNLNIRQHRVTFVEKGRPALILIGEENAVNNAYA